MNLELGHMGSIPYGQARLSPTSRNLRQPEALGATCAHNGT